MSMQEPLRTPIESQQPITLQNNGSILGTNPAVINVTNGLSFVLQPNGDYVLSGQGNFLGYYLDQTALTTAHPTATAGDFAIVESTGTIWIWDNATSQWTDTGNASGAASGPAGAVQLSDGAAGFTNDTNLSWDTGNSTLNSVGFAGSDYTVDLGGQILMRDVSDTYNLTLRNLGTMTGDVTFSLPPADGTSGQALVTDGSGNLSFDDVVVPPAGPSGAIQYNDGGVFGGEAAFMWNATGNQMQIGRGSAVTTLTIGANASSTSLPFDLTGLIPGATQATSNIMGKFEQPISLLGGNTLVRPGMTLENATDGTTSPLDPTGEAAAPALFFSRARGSVNTRTSVIDGDQAGVFGAQAFVDDGVNPATYRGIGEIQFEVDGTPTAGNIPGKIQFSVPHNTANPFPETAMQIRSTGAVDIADGQVSGNEALSIRPHGPMLGNALGLYANSDTNDRPEFFIGSDNGNGLNLRAPSGMSATYTLDLPADVGSNGQVLTTDGAGTTSWTTVSGGASSSGVSGDIQLADGVGGFNADGLFNYDIDAELLNVVNAEIANTDTNTLEVNSGATFDGTVDITNNRLQAQAGAAIRFGNTLGLYDSGNTNNVSFVAPATVNSSYTIILPADQGAAGTVLENDGSGNLTWGTPSSNARVITNATVSGGAYTHTAVGSVQTLRVNNISSGTPPTITLDETSMSPQDGDRITILDVGNNAGTDNITIQSSLYSINGGTATIITNGGNVTLEFNGNQSPNLWYQV